MNIFYLFETIASYDIVYCLQGRQLRNFKFLKVSFKMVAGDILKYICVYYFVFLRENKAFDISFESSA